MKPSLQLKLSQHLALTPQLQQSIRLLQLSTLELQQELNQLIADNPLLEFAEPVGQDALDGALPLVPREAVTETPTQAEQEPSGDTADQLNADRATESAEAEFENDAAPSEEWPSSPESRDDDDNAFQQACSETLRVMLLEQARMLNVDEDTHTLVRMMVEAIDEAGFLGVTRDELNMILAEASGEIAPQISVDLWDRALTHLQSFEPAGVGARSLQECICLQLKAMPETVPQIDALDIVSKYYDALIAKDAGRIKRALQFEDEDFKAAIALIQLTNTRPGAPYSDDVAAFVVPDVIVKKSRRRWVAQLNPSTMPKLRINQIYASILSANKAGRTTPMSAQLQEARWLIKNVEQRFATILRVTTSIVARQQQFFEHGDIAMRPLTLREIAEELGLHESTISRVTSSKYMATPRGVFELKYFFGSGVATDTGGSASATAIKAMIKQLIGGEDTRKPLTDSTLAELLEAQGVLVARRTVAKYREMLGVRPVSERRGA
jgi:RNA polymerase sigma-54 factor